MSSTDDTAGGKRIRTALLQKWPEADFSTLATDEVLKRLADARNTASKSANIFMLVAALLSLLYVLRLEGLASNIGVGSYNLASLPFGLFVLSAAALVCACVSLIRIGDSRAYDRQLMLSCEQRFGCECHLRYIGFPNEFGWGEPFSQMAGVVRVGTVAAVLRGITILLINLYLLGLVAAPIASGFDFLLNNRSLVEAKFEFFQVGIVAFLLATNVSVFFLVLWLRLVDRD